MKKILTSLRELLGLDRQCFSMAKSHFHQKILNVWKGLFWILHHNATMLTFNLQVSRFQLEWNRNRVFLGNKFYKIVERLFSHSIYKLNFLEEDCSLKVPQINEKYHAWDGSKKKTLFRYNQLSILRFLSKDSSLIRAYGAIRFNADMEPSEEWKSFGSFFFFIPQVSMYFLSLSLSVCLF